MENIEWSVRYKCKHLEPCFIGITYDKETDVYTRKYSTKEDAVMQFLYKYRPYLLAHTDQYSDIRIFKGDEDYTENLMEFLKDEK